MNRRPVIDAFIYNGEALLLKLRLEWMTEYVDHFIIVESKQTFNGDMKSRYYIDDQQDLLSKYNVTVLKFETCPPRDPEWDRIHPYPSTEYSEKWHRDYYTRSYAKQYILDAYPNQEYIIISCDMDEIPIKPILADIQSLYEPATYGISLNMRLFRYNFKWEEDRQWEQKAAIFNDKMLQRYEIDDIRNIILKQYVIHQAGWHLSSFLSLHDIRRKIISLAHIENNTSKIHDLQEFSDAVANGQHIAQNELCQMPRSPYPVPEQWQHIQVELEQLQRVRSCYLEIGPASKVSEWLPQLIGAMILTARLHRNILYVDQPTYSIERWIDIRQLERSMWERGYLIYIHSADGQQERSIPYSTDPEDYASMISVTCLDISSVMLSVYWSMYHDDMMHLIRAWRFHPALEEMARWYMSTDSYMIMDYNLAADRCPSGIDASLYMQQMMEKYDAIAKHVNLPIYLVTSEMSVHRLDRVMEMAPMMQDERLNEVMDMIVGRSAQVGILQGGRPLSEWLRWVLPVIIWISVKPNIIFDKNP